MVRFWNGFVALKPNDNYLMFEQRGNVGNFLLVSYKPLKKDIKQNKNENEYN